jgi:hypothetical protein
MEFDAGERAHLTEMRSLSTDNAGNEIFVGLTVQESQEYYRFTRLHHRSNGDSAATDRYLELNEKHERARLAVLGAEVDSRHDMTSRH